MFFQWLYDFRNWLQSDQTKIVDRLPLEGIHGRFYVSPMPFGPYDPFRQVFKLYRRLGIDCIVPLVTEAEIQAKCKVDLLKLYRETGYKVLHTPFADLTKPDTGKIRELVPKIIERLQTEYVAVHCNAGVGRTGIIAACTVMKLTGWTPEQTLSFLKAKTFINLTDEQRRFIQRWPAAEATTEIQPG